MSSQSLTPLGKPAEFDGGLQEIAPGTYAWIQPNGELGESNAGLVVGAGSSLLIDTLFDEELTRRMLREMSFILRKGRIATVLNTHGDGDHWYGNGAVWEAEFVATAAAARQMREEPPTMITRTVPLRIGAGLFGKLPVAPWRQRLRGIAAFGSELDCYAIGDVTPRLPDREFSGTLTLDVGGRTVEVTEVGPAHSPGDAIAWLADVRVLFSADIVFSGVTPIIWVGPVENWIRALNKVESLEPVAIVPGHGPVCDVGVVAELRDYWLWLQDAVRADGETSAPAVARRILESKDWRDRSWSGWRAPERTLINVAMILREARGETGPLGTLARIRLLAEMGALRARLGG